MSQDHLLRRPTLETFGLWSKFNQTTGPSTDVVEEKEEPREAAASLPRAHLSYYCSIGFT